MAYAEELRQINDPEAREATELALLDKAEELETSEGLPKAQGWFKAATGKTVPLSAVYEKYVADKGRFLSQSTLNNLKTAYEDFKTFAKGDVPIDAVDRKAVSEFITDYLPNLKTPKSPNGPSPATIRKKVSMLAQLWHWAMARGYLPMEPMTPWDKQAPSKKEVRAASKKRRAFTAEETRKLLSAAPAGKALGDVIRIALLTGTRLEEIVSLDASNLDEDCGGYVVAKGKTESASRYVPLVGVAQEIVKRRYAEVKKTGPLFPELPVRESTGKRGAAISQRFTRLRRKVLGDHTDGELAEHSFRHTWRTAARRAGVDLRTTHDMGGWSRGDNADTIYDHGLEKDHYRDEQAKVERWLKKERYLTE